MSQPVLIVDSNRDDIEPSDITEQTMTVIDSGAAPDLTAASTPRRDLAGRAADTEPPAVDIVVPVHNEQAALGASILRLHRFLTEQLPVTWRITIVDNASTDATWPLACELAHSLPGVRPLRLAHKGRGRALRHAWSTSDAAVLVYMDVDLSTDLTALPPLVAPLLSGHSDLAIGTRLAPGSRVVRGPKRELISRCYNGIVRTALHARFSDAQCGFKAIRRDRAALLLPLVEDQAWFFDTELLVLAERAGMRIHEVPVDWVDDPDSRVDIVPTAVADLRGVARLLRGFVTGRLDLSAVRAGLPPQQRLVGQITRFAAIGLLSTAAYLVLYVMLRGALGALAANAVALLVTAIGNTAANRRVTFHVTSRDGRWRHQAQGFVVFALALAMTSTALLALRSTDPHPSRALDGIVLVVTNLAATAVRFCLLRGWVFRRRSA